jgi:chorismate dehydratase
LGVVSYLNVQPLIWSLHDGEGTDHWEIISARPRELAGRLRAGEFHAAMVPVFEYFSSGLPYTIVPGASIATRGPVGSVMLYSESPLDEVHTILLDPSSLTSVNLCRVLMAERQAKITFEEPTPEEQSRVALKGVARLLIGDPAISERGKHRHEYDLGALWHDMTGLPFVFAAWLVHPSAAQMPLNAPLTRAREVGEANFSVIAKVAPRFGTTPEFALEYFRMNMEYDLGETEFEGLETYGKLLAKHGLIASAPSPLRLHEV